MKLLTALLVLTSTAALAEVPMLSMSAGYSTQVFTTRGYDLIGYDDNLHQGRIAVGTGFNLSFGALDLVPYGGWDLDGTPGAGVDRHEHDRARRDLNPVAFPAENLAKRERAAATAQCPHPALEGVAGKDLQVEADGDLAHGGASHRVEDFGG